jgi:hypothetical protein
MCLDQKYVDTSSLKEKIFSSQMSGLSHSEITWEVDDVTVYNDKPAGSDSFILRSWRKRALNGTGAHLAPGKELQWSSSCRDARGGGLYDASADKRLSGPHAMEHMPG